MSHHPFADLPPTPAQHFRLVLFAAVRHLLDRLPVAFGSRESAVGSFPFLKGYEAEFAGLGLTAWNADRASTWWEDALDAWEDAIPGHLPLRALRRAAGLDHPALTMLLAAGLIEEDARFGPVFEAAQATPGQRRPTMALLNAWWRDDPDGGRVRDRLRRLLELRLLQAVNPESPRLEWALQVPGPVWDALRGEAHDSPAPWATHRLPATLRDLDELIVPDALRAALNRLPALLGSGEARAIVVRGPRRNGRRTTLGAIARRLGRGLLEVQGTAVADADRWKLVGPLATLLNALPMAVLDLGPGETAQLPDLPAFDGPLGLVLGRHGGAAGPAVERALTLTLEMPDADLRGRHWSEGLGGAGVGRADLEVLRERFRMTGSNVRRAAGLARAHAAFEGRADITPADVRHACRALNRQAFDTLAAWVPATGHWGELSVASETACELESLESRCRHRERLWQFVGEALGPHGNRGVRALFCGPSGTGKSMAARLLAAALEMDLYRLDLSAVVNKYIGETEKSLNQVFTLAEELDVILLLDEGDALMTRRTAVQSSNDRYANLETNYLLQRVESYDGILIVTTNAPDSIDGAFRRRMDVVVDFEPPGAQERWAIWQSHLPPGHAVGGDLLQEVAGRCPLTGAQIRNAVLHASLLALEDGGVVRSGDVDAAVQREYRKAGGVCPLRRASTPTAVRR